MGPSTPKIDETSAGRHHRVKKKKAHNFLGGCYRRCSWNLQPVTPPPPEGSSITRKRQPGQGEGGGSGSGGRGLGQTGAAGGGRRGEAGGRGPRRGGGEERPPDRPRRGDSAARPIPSSGRGFARQQSQQPAKNPFQPKCARKGWSGSRGPNPLSNISGRYLAFFWVRWPRPGVLSLGRL